MTSAASVDEIVRRLVTDPAAIADPYPLYDELRAFGEVVRSSAGTAFVISYRSCQALLRHPRFGKYLPPSELGENPILHRVMRYMHPDEHPRLRRLLGKAIAASMPPSGELDAAVDAQVDRLVDDAAGTVDLVEALADPLPAAVIGYLLGIPPSELPHIGGLMAQLAALEYPDIDREQLAAAVAAEVELTDHFAALVAERRRRPDAGLLSNLAAVEDGGGRLTDADVVNAAFLVLNGGYATTSQLIGHLAVAFFEHPQQLDLVRHDPTLIGPAVDECLRWESPIQFQARIAEERTEVGGHRLPVGASVMAIFGAGNRDPETFRNPHRFDVTRTGHPALTFGGGAHHCLGARLTRTTGEAVVRRLFLRHRVTSAGPPARRGVVSLRAFTSIPVEVNALGQLETCQLSNEP